MNPIEHALINALLFVPLTSLPSAEVAICIDNLRSVFLGLAHLLEPKSVNGKDDTSSRRLIE